METSLDESEENMERTGDGKAEAKFPLGGTSTKIAQTIMYRYKESGDLFADIDKLASFGKCNPANGMFDFFFCPNCKGPKLGQKRPRGNLQE